jgi:GT2 family glycosyltransferase
VTKVEKSAGLTIAVPTYCREKVLIETVHRLLSLNESNLEILVLDQSAFHMPQVQNELSRLHASGEIRLFSLNEPSIPKAMNRGLVEATHDLVLFVDDDTVPESNLIRAHVAAHAIGKGRLVAGRIIQPWQEGSDFSGESSFHFASLRRVEINDFMGGNFSVDRNEAIAVGGFDENFVGVAYKFEAEFAYRWREAGYSIFFEPEACVHHLKVSSGGTRIFGNHLRTSGPDHSVGAYYSYLRTWSGSSTLRLIVNRLLAAVTTKYHLKHPWHILTTLIGEVRGLIWACRLARGGPRYIRDKI